MKFASIFGVFILLLPTLAFSQNNSVVSHTCEKPKKPSSYKDFAEFSEFNEDFIRYKKCMNSFINEHEKAMEMHHQAATNAVLEWNQYIKQNVN